MKDKKPKVAMLLKRLLGSVKNVEQAVKKQTEAINSENKKEREEQYPSPEMRAEVRFPHYVERDREIQGKKNYSIQKWGVIAAWATLVMVTAYAAIAAWQLYEMHQSVELTKKALQASQTAVLALGIEVRQNPSNTWLLLKFTNKGNSPGREIDGDISFVRKNEKGEVLQSESRHFHKSAISPTNGDFDEILPLNGPFKIEQYRKEDWYLNVTIAYDDGIERRTQVFCRGLVIEKNGYGWEDCDNARARRQYPPD